MESSGDYVRGDFCIEVVPVPNIIIILGASGNLARTKLIPSLFSLFCRGLFHEKSRIIGCGRTSMSSDTFRRQLEKHLKENAAKNNKPLLHDFLERVSYLSGDYGEQATYRRLRRKLESLEKQQSPMPNRTFYLSTPAALYPTIVPLLGEHGLTAENYAGTPWRHVILEKPFGYDLASAEELDRLLHKTLSERQIYRIDHYLGKETVQNILMLRFANIIFEPVWNRHYIDNVQISVAESIGIENRAGYYEKAGLLRDMFQNHMLEMLSLVAMEMPGSFDANAVRDEKLKLIRAIRPFPIDKLGDVVVRGQYTGAGEMPGYREEIGVSPDSNTETYVAAKLMIDNWRWQGVPFYMRSGKRLKRKISEIAITFKRVPHSIFAPVRSLDLAADTLVLNVQPEEGMALTVQAKKPGPKLCMGSLTLDFKYREVFGGQARNAYERLLLDAMLGDQTLFIRSDVIAASWQLFTPVLDAWRQSDATGLSSHCPYALHCYPCGAQGPEAAEKILGQYGTAWRQV